MLNQLRHGPEPGPAERKAAAVELTLRKEKILASVIAGYIQHGEPVGSKAIAEEIGVSSATVRNEMASLTELGLLEQPHTSAGRVPSQKGYREFVDRLMTPPDLGVQERRWVDSRLAPAMYDSEQLLLCASQLLAGLSKCTAAVTTPGGPEAVVKAVQLVQTSRRTAMLLMISSAGTMKSRVFRCDYDLTNDILRVFFRVFNEKVAGKRVKEVTPAFLQNLGASLGPMYALVGTPLRALLEAAEDTAHTETLLSGQMNLLLYSELGTSGVRRVLGFLDRGEGMEALLRQKPGRITALIGRECGWPELEEASVLVSRYSVSGQDAGAIAIIGPVRMDYPRLTSVLSYLSEKVSTQLTQLARED